MSTEINDPNAEFDALMQAANSEVPIKWNGTQHIKVRDAIKRTRQMAFLKALAELGTISHACKAAGVNSNTERGWRDTNDPWYAEQFRDALQSFRDLVEREVHVRAVEGVDEPIIGRVSTPTPMGFMTEDKIIGYKKKKSDLLLIFHAKRHIPEYREKPPEVKDDKPTETGSPMARITVRLEMMSKRQQVEIPDGADNSHIIDITPEQKQIESPTDGI